MNFPLKCDKRACLGMLGDGKGCKNGVGQTKGGENPKKQYLENVSLKPLFGTQGPQYVENWCLKKLFFETFFESHIKAHFMRKVDTLFGRVKNGQFSGSESLK